MKVEFFLPTITAQDKRSVSKVLDSGFLSTWSTVKQFEEDFAKYLRSEYAIGTMSCTAALQLCLLTLGIGKGDEVITTPLSFVATANAIELTGARPVFVDVEKDTGLIDVSKIEKAITKKTKAIIPVHLYGHMCDMKALSRLAKRYHLAIIEDSAHAVEAEREGVRPGELGYAACFSFHSLKNITSGEGGAILVHDENVARKLKILRLHGLVRTASDQYKKVYKHNDMECLGWKYNMNEIQAALLVSQLKRIGKQWRIRKQLVDRYNEGFRGNPAIRTISTLPNTKNAHHLYTILVPNGQRDQLLEKLQKREIGVAINYTTIPLMKFYKEKYGYKPGAFPVAEDIGNRTITLPLYPRLAKKEQDYVIATVNELVKL